MLEEGGGLRRLASLRPRRGGEVIMLSSTLSEEDDDDGELDHTAYAAHASTGEAASFHICEKRPLLAHSHLQAARLQAHRVCMHVYSSHCGTVWLAESYSQATCFNRGQRQFCKVRGGRA